MNKNITFLTVILFLLSYTGFSQNNADAVIFNEKPVTSGNLAVAKELPLAGTYQIVFKNGTEKRKIADDILFLANEKREYDNTVFIEVDKNTQIKVLPFKEINSRDFLPLPTYVVE